MRWPWPASWLALQTDPFRLAATRLSEAELLNSLNSELAPLRQQSAANTVEDTDTAADDDNDGNTAAEATETNAGR